MDTTPRVSREIDTDPAPAASGGRVAVAGATGFVGRPLVDALAERFEVVALGRRAPSRPAPEGGVGVVWRRCDLFSLRECESALEGVETAFYLVHSMMPNARLTQASFEDLDLLLADNFARAAASAGVRRIVYLGGLVPEDWTDSLSSHLESRVEVERALAAHGVPVTAIRAGLVVGPGGSSLQMLVRLVERLPVMLVPRWTQTLTQPIALDDVVAILAHCLDDPETAGRVCEVGGPDVLSYREMMRETARVLQRRRLMFPVPFFSPGFSRLWVSLVTRTPRALVAPLVESLRHPMLAEDDWLQQRMGLPGRPFREALALAVRSGGVAREPAARSVQRLPLPPGRDAAWVSREYAAWLPQLLRPVLRVAVDGPVCRIGCRGIARPLLELTHRPERSGPGRALFDVTGGLLAGDAVGSPRLEFRVTPDGESVLAAVQDFRPRLPWWIYLQSQARLHLWVMRAFARHLRRVARRPRLASQGPSGEQDRPEPEARVS
ncbi:MAG: NAD(P)H-binding protein [Myxococcota bacterium]